MASIDRFFDALAYEDLVLISRDGVGFQDADTGVFVLGTSETVLSCMADVQDERLRISRDRLGNSYADANGMIYFGSDAEVHVVKPGDAVQAERDGRIRVGIVAEVLHFERAVAVTWY